jgi:hypothetical protein
LKYSKSALLLLILFVMAKPPRQWRPITLRVHCTITVPS